MGELSREQTDASYGHGPDFAAAINPGQGVRYFLIEQPPGDLVGAMWLGEVEPVIGFVPVDPASPTAWGERCTAAMRATSGDGSAAFAYWSEAANGITWSAGPVERAGSLGALRDLVAKAAADRRG